MAIDCLPSAFAESPIANAQPPLAFAFDNRPMAIAWVPEAVDLPKSSKARLSHPALAGLVQWQRRSPRPPSRCVLT